MYEVEVKAHLRNREAVLKKLEDFGCKFSEELHQVDRIFAPKGTPLPRTPLGTTVLRVRKQNNLYFFTLKIPQSSHQDCIERDGDKRWRKNDRNPRAYEMGSTSYCRQEKD